jgi:hypothetical protein
MNFPSACASRFIAFKKAKAHEHTIVPIEINAQPYIVAPHAACLLLRARMRL